ncbi:Abi family protein [Priestia flexa]|uniref:Abi family protein n=3 Tax=Priestia flexa TaxID=86664 RepID=UPI001294708B|nr:Abi family protein [Priestia flexa]MED4589410.1 Abi family protein [Priestia flexa]
MKEKTNIGDFMERPFRTLDEQIKILIGRKLVIDDIEGAKFLLTKHGYYSIINGYKDIFLKVKTSLTEDDCFKENVNFNEIINLYRFDVEVRNSILSALENIESTLQTNIAYILSDKYGDKQQDYLRPSNFRLGQRTRNGRMQRDVLLENLKAICIKDQHPMKHYRTRYGNVPPWILVKGLTFGNIIYITSVA